MNIYMIHEKPMSLQERKAHMAERGNWREVARLNKQMELQGNAH